MYLVTIESYEPKTRRCHPVKMVMCNRCLTLFQQEMEYLWGYVAIQSRRAPAEPAPRPLPPPGIDLAVAIQAAPRSCLSEQAHVAILCCLLHQACTPHPATGTMAATLLINDIFALLNDQHWSLADLTDLRPDFVQACADLVALRAGGFITARHARQIMQAVWRMPYLTVADYIVASGLLDETDEGAIRAIIAEVIIAHPKIVGQYRAGKTNVAGFLVGQTMKALGGKADPRKIQELVAGALVD